MARTYMIEDIDRKIHRLSEARAECYRQLGSQYHDTMGLFAPGHVALVRQIQSLTEQINTLYVEKRRIAALEYLREEMQRLPRYQLAA